MRIMIHSNGPMVPSGYGKQTSLLIGQLSELGHDVAVSSFHGVTGAIVEWNGVPIYPSGAKPYGVDVMLPHANHFGAEVLLTLMDTWTLMPIVDHLAGSLALDGAPTLACWTPVDCEPMSQGDRYVLTKTGAVPVAMSRHGFQQMEHAGLKDPWYVPHSIDTHIFRPWPEGREAIRRECGTDPETFVIGIVAANRDWNRKAWAEQFEAFALHLRAYPDSELWAHTMPDGTHGAGGHNLKAMAAQMGIAHKVRWSDEYAQMCGLIEDMDMALWYSAIDLLSSCSYGEGFGLPIIEAQACGVPAIATRASAMTEHATELVDGERWWNAVHDAWWKRPYAPEISTVYDRYRRQKAAGTLPPAEKHQEKAKSFAVDEVTNRYWKPLLDSIEGGRPRRPSGAAVMAEDIVRGLADD